MFYFPDILVLCCLFTSGYFFGYYFKFAYIYDNLWNHWYALIGIISALSLAGAWTLKKYKERQYRFNHFYVIFYGLVCYVINCCFMLTDNLDIAFYFGFVGLSTTLISSYSYISLRSSSEGLRPARIALGNTFFFTGFTTGFTIFNEFESKRSGWIFLGISTLTLLGTVANEVLQNVGIHNYRQSRDLVFNLMNDEKLLFVTTKSIYALFVGRHEFYMVKNRQWLVVGMSTVLVLDRIFFFSASLWQLTWSSSFAYMSAPYLYGPCLLYSIGCCTGVVLITRYKPKVIYLMFGLIKLTVMAAILGVYAEESTEKCFLFLCFFYISLGVYSSVALQMVLECTPFLYTELALAVMLSLELFVLEMLKYETNVNNSWSILLGISISSMILTAVSMVVTQLFLPSSKGLIDIRNKLLGVRRHQAVVSQSKIWSANYFLQHDLPQSELKQVKLSGNRVFQQYPREPTISTTS